MSQYYRSFDWKPDSIQCYNWRLSAFNISQFKWCRGKFLWHLEHFFLLTVGTADDSYWYIIKDIIIWWQEDMNLFVCLFKWPEQCAQTSCDMVFTTRM